MNDDDYENDMKTEKFLMEWMNHHWTEKAKKVYPSLTFDDMVQLVDSENPILRQRAKKCLEAGKKINF